MKHHSTLAGLVLWLGAPGFVHAQSEAPEAGVGSEASVDDVKNEDAEAPAPNLESAPSAAASPWLLTGYVDVGFAAAQGDGTSFPAGDLRLPADYGVDAFAPAINSLGEVASTDAHGRFVNGFLPRSAGIGGKPSVLINVVNADFLYRPSDAPVLIFARVQALPRLYASSGSTVILLVPQAFGSVTPFSNIDLHVSLGRFDSPFGIEYLDNASIDRIGITPSLFARYTTGTPVGIKAFYRLQLPRLWSALSVNASATNGGTMVDALQPPEISLTGSPVGSGRIGYELNLRRAQVKLGVSGSLGPRNDQSSDTAVQRMGGFDVRMGAMGLLLSGEMMWVHEDHGSSPKRTGLGQYPLSSEFAARGFWVQLAYLLRLDGPVVAGVGVYGRVERRHAAFEGFRPLTVQRLTLGARIDLWQSLLTKVEYLVNQEEEGAPTVSNNVLAMSAVWSW